MNRLTRIALTTTAAVALFPLSATAQELPEIPAGSDTALRDLVVSSNANPRSSGSSVQGLVSSLSLLGSSELPLREPFMSSDDRYPLPLDETITDVQILEKRVERADERVERWFVTSPSMSRVVEVQIKKAADPLAPAPMLYLLDGIGGSTSSSGWVSHGEAERVFGDENVTLVMPTQAAGSLYSDWLHDDPALGRHMWETFITEELAPVLEAEAELNFNGKRGIGGLSMGAIGAVHIANTHPELFDATFGISGCYSPNDGVGRQMVNLVVASRGGDPENMWGPYGTELWDHHDTTANPEGLRDMAVYLSAANGVIEEDDRMTYDDDPFFTMSAGSVLEIGVLSCTEKLDRAMRDRGMDHHVVDYKGPGVHNWSNYNEQLQPAWDAIRDALV